MAGINELWSHKQFKGEHLQRGCSLNENQLDYPRIPTYIANIDIALGGGIPCGAITQLYGKWQGGKSTASYLAAKGLSKTCIKCLKPKIICDCAEGPTTGKTFLIQTEGAPPSALYLAQLGYDASEENLVVYQTKDGAKVCTAIEEAVKYDDVGLVIVDSIANVQPASYYEDDYSELNIGSQSKLLKRMSARVAWQLADELRRGHNVAVIFLNQQTSIIGAARWEPTEGVTGGFGIKHNVRLSIQCSQLSTKEMDKDEGTKDVLRFSLNLNGACSKQQLYTMLGKTEYQLVMRDWGDYHPGDVVDHNLVIDLARKIEMITKGKDGYEFHGTPKMKFRVLSDIESVFSTHEYLDNESGKIIYNADDIIRFSVLQEVKRRNVRKIMDQRKIKVIAVKPESPASDEPQEGSDVSM